MSVKKRLPRSPDFFCIGAQKAGTTWLHENLSQHPGAWMPPVKELQYFNQIHIPGHKGWTQWHRDKHASNRLTSYIGKRDDLNLHYVRTLAHITDPAIDDAWYREVFSYAGENQICGDMTPEYSLLPEAGIKHMLTLAPRAKYLFIMRDPIDRAWSHVRMNYRRGVSPGTELLDLAKLGDIRARSDYMTILQRWRALLAPGQLFVGVFDDISRRPTAFLREVMAFLGLSYDAELFKSADKVVHAGAALDMPDDVYDLMREQYAPVYDALDTEAPDIAQEWRARHYR